MKNLNIYVFSIIAVGLLAFSCKDAIQAEEGGGNQTDTSSVEKSNESKNVQLADPLEAKKIVSKTTLTAKSGSNATGEIIFEEKLGQVVMEAKFEGLNPGTHAIHLHETANCSSDDGKSAGGHWNPTNERHGKWGDAEGFHKGDIGNFEVKDDGTATVNFETADWCIGCDDETKNIIGRSVIIHEGGDDFISQPSGDAGKRVGCAEISEYHEK
ncbi:superoxide dismutase family protein [Brumimicrobium oceani]|uniref:Superoxide dismutase [Cu-Zn] n=1 Tax=Brumimicrobium oceani TaxID=2100725 RepID=A0A2U2XD96_9FLAO|nr:superoxide dismutase family protein [Brumimicrobium oceani]PWH85775.1 superoxide dismutase [Brumimicrobium oceani]